MKWRLKKGEREELISRSFEGESGSARRVHNKCRERDLDLSASTESMDITYQYPKESKSASSPFGLLCLVLMSRDVRCWSDCIRQGQR